MPDVTTPRDATPKVVQELSDWADRFLAAARAGDAPRAGNAMAGLVDWLGHDLVDHMFSMDVATWEALSGLAEELFQAMRGGHEALRGAGGAAWPGRLAAEAAIGAIVAKARGIGAAGETRCR